jgi:hypothetical protein
MTPEEIAYWATPAVPLDAEATASVRPAVIGSAGDVADTATAAFMLLLTGHEKASEDILGELTPADRNRVAHAASTFALAADPGAAYQPAGLPADRIGVIVSDAQRAALRAIFDFVPDDADDLIAMLPAILFAQESAAELLATAKAGQS